MKSIILMFGGGLVGGMIGPVAALIGAAAGFFIGRHWGVSYCLRGETNPINQGTRFPDRIGGSNDQFGRKRAELSNK